MSGTAHGRVVALAGGVGGARLVDGLARVLPVGALQVVVNTGDDFRHWGLHISPDLDTIMYTLAGLAPQDRGWGIEGDTFAALEEAKRRGEPTWFQLGDRDLVTHMIRTEALAQGISLTEVTAKLCRSLDVRHQIMPMSDRPRSTTIITSEDEALPFQHWLVRSRAAPHVKSVIHGGSPEPSDQALEALRGADLVIVCPSNPFVSIEPILNLRGVRETLERTPTIAVSPILNGRAVKGPLGSMVSDLMNREPSAEAVAARYSGLLDAFAVHTGDRFEAPFEVFEADVLIPAVEDRVRLAGELLGLAERLR